MKNDDLLKLIKEKAKINARHRKDKRFIDAMGFLVAKGFLKTNLAIPGTPNKKLKLDDVIWAGKNVEPRILEVLPAAALRLEKHFDLDPVKHAELVKVLQQLKKNQEDGDDFLGVPYKKFKVWVELRLRDGRVKTVSEKKVVKTFRLKPKTLSELEKRAKDWKCTETEVIEKILDVQPEA